jgi:hypothetical protein
MSLIRKRFLVAEKIHTLAVDYGRLRLVNEISLDRFQQRRLIAFDREQVVSALVGDLTGDVPLAPPWRQW